LNLTFNRRTVRGRNNSWAAVSTCDGLYGLFHDGSEMFHVEKVPDDDDVNNGTTGITGAHFLYRHSGMTSVFVEQSSTTECPR
jgi:hypothetical protein